MLSTTDIFSFGGTNNHHQANIDDSDAVGDRYVGQNSIPALLRDQSSASNTHDSAGIRQDMRSILGLDNSAPFPLMSGKHLQRLAQDISTELPSDREVMKFVYLVPQEI